MSLIYPCDAAGSVNIAAAGGGGSTNTWNPARHYPMALYVSQLSRMAICTGNEEYRSVHLPEREAVRQRVDRKILLGNPYGSS